MEHYREMEKSDVDAVKKLSDEYIGVDFYNEIYLESIVDDPDRVVNLYIVDDGSIRGFQYGMLSDLDICCNILNLDNEAKEQLIAQYPECGNELLGIFKTIVVDPSCRGSGVSEELNSRTAMWFKNRGVKLAVGEALIRPDGIINARNTMEHTNQRVLFKVKQPWIDIKSYCPYCKQEYCHCDAAIFVKEI